MYKVGLTGLIGSGKSIVADFFAKLCIDVIDTDKIAYLLTTSDGIALPQIISTFGKDYLAADGSLDRKKMRQLIFKDIPKRQALESILHPLILEEVLSSILRAEGLYVIIVVPLLFRSPDFMEIMDRTIFVDCIEEAIIERVKKRDSITEYEVKEILQAQLSREVQLNLADDILSNNGDVLALKKQVIELDKKYKRLFYDNYRDI